MQKCKSAKVQRCKGAKVQRCKGAKVQRCKGTKVQRCKCARCKGANLMLFMPLKGFVTDGEIPFGSYISPVGT